MNPGLLSLHDTSPEVLWQPESELGLRYNQNEPDLNTELEQPGEKIWGMERKTFMIVLGILILLIIAVTAGVGGGVARSAAKKR